MKVLLVHNFYQSSSPSGEDIVFRNEVALLKSKGVDVVTYERFNDDIGKNVSKIRASFKTVWSKDTYRELKSLIKKEKPDIAHFHNIWYLISPSAYYACKDSGVPVVQTLHNFRIFCANGLLLRNGKICKDCVGKVPWRSIIYGCYRNSSLYSIPVAITQGFHRFISTWTDRVDAYIVLTEFGKEKFIEAGLPEKNIFVKPNFMVKPPAEPKFAFGDYVLFVGRVSKEKGIMTLLKAWKNINGLSLKIAGDGPLMQDVIDYIEKHKLKNIHLLGRLSHNDVINCMREAMFVIFPSEWYETFGMIITEAYACGKPVVASNLGAMAELVENGKTGLLFEPGNPVDLAEKIQWMLKNENACIQMSNNAGREFEEKYNAERNYSLLMDIYQKSIQNNR